MSMQIFTYGVWFGWCSKYVDILLNEEILMVALLKPCGFPKYFEIATLSLLKPS